MLDNVFYYGAEKEKHYSKLTSSIAKYYDFNTVYGDFRIDDLSPKLQQKLIKIFNISSLRDEVSLLEINDNHLINHENKIKLLTEVIKSGAIFKKSSTLRRNYGDYLS